MCNGREKNKNKRKKKGKRKEKAQILYVAVLTVYPIGLYV